MTPTTETGQSGSDNYHSRLAPSAAKRWMECSASVRFIEENDDKIFPTKVGKVVRLTRYLKSMPPEEVKDHEWRAIQIADDITNRRRTIESLTPEERKDIEYTEGSEASRKGTRAHDFAEAILNGRKTLDDIPEEFRDGLRIYVEHCLSLVPEGVTPLIEQVVPLFYSENPDDTGTTDFAVVTPDVIHIRDYKNGGGEEEIAVENKQLSIYGLSLIEYLDPVYDFAPDTKVTLGIVQPNHHAGAAVKEWETTVGDLRKFCQDVHHKAIQIRVGKVTRFSPSDSGCLWCDARGFCPAREKALEVVNVEESKALIALLPDLDKAEKKLPALERFETRMTRAGIPSEMLTHEYRVGLYRHMKNLIAVLEDNAEALELEQIGGANIPGLKLVMSREGNRAWANEEEADTFLRGKKLKEAERYNYKLKSPTEMEKVLDIPKAPKRTQTRWEELVTRSPGKPVLALADDRREAIGAPVDLLPDLSGDDEV